MTPMIGLASSSRSSSVLTKDWRADPPEEKETVKVRAISPAKTTQNGGAPASKPPLPPSRVATSAKDDPDDIIPF